MITKYSKKKRYSKTIEVQYIDSMAHNQKTGLFTSLIKPKLRH